MFRFAKHISAAIIALAGALAMIATDTRAGEPEISGATPTHSVRVQVRHVFGKQLLRYDDVSLRNDAGNTFSVSRLAYLVSGVTLTRENGKRVALEDQFAYLNPTDDRSTFDLTGVPEGKYTGIAFNIGLDAATNHSDPAKYGPDHPLNPIVNALHWGWQGGYVFLVLEGRYERPHGELGGYSYHIATDPRLMRVTLEKPLAIKSDSLITLDFDLARVFQGIAIKHEGGGDSTHSGEKDALAVVIAANVKGAFRVASIQVMEGETPTPVSTQPVSTAAALPSGTKPYEIEWPAQFPPPFLPPDNPLTVEGVSLGKRLFFEKKLSGNDSQSCANCHRPRDAFSDAGRRLSKGIDGQLGTRNSMALFNLAWATSLTWDGRRTRLRDQALGPIQDEREMHQTLAQTEKKLAADREYPKLFERAFGSPGVTSERVGLALEQYMLTLVSADSKFDRASRGEEQLTEQEKRGLTLFITEYDPARGKYGADCFHCHGGNLFTDSRFKNNGLRERPGDKDRSAITARDSDIGKFKTPSLRNVEVTGPYMHDGRFDRLEDVVAHYSDHVERSPTLDPNLAKHPEEGIHLSREDRDAIVAFLKTLTDEQFKRAGDRPRVARGRDENAPRE